MDINEIAENLTELLTNTVNMTSVFYDIFLNPEPMDVDIDMFNNENELVTVTIPNRAKDKQTAYSGEGSPEGIQVAPVGSTYVDTLNSEVYFKVDGTDAFGWVVLPSQEAVEAIALNYLSTKGYITENGLRQYLITNQYITDSILQEALSHKQDNLVSGISIKTINSESLLEAGNINLLKSGDNISELNNDLGYIRAIPTATSTTLGIARPDNNSIIINNGVLSTVQEVPVGQPQFTLNFGSLPVNCIWLEGATVSRTTYAKLFAIYGTTYGAGDGSTTFTLPNFRGQVIWGEVTPGYIGAGLPDHLHWITSTYSLSQYIGGSGDTRDWVRPKVGNTTTYSSWASASNAIYGRSTTVQPPAIKVRFYTRYQ